MVTLPITFKSTFADSKAVAGGANPDRRGQPLAGARSGRWYGAVIKVNVRESPELDPPTGVGQPAWPRRPEMSHGRFWGEIRPGGVVHRTLTIK